MAGNYVSSSDLMGTELQRLLTQRRADARQSLIDDISRRQAESNIAAQTENVASSKMLREAQAANFAATTQERNAKNLTMHQALDPDHLPNIDPNLIDTPKQRPNPINMDSEIAFGPLAGDQYAQMGTAPSIPGALQPPDENDVTRFKGLPADQEAESRQKQLEDLQHSEEFKKADQLHQVMMYNRVSDPTHPIPPGTWMNPPEAKHSPSWMEYQDYLSDEQLGGRTPKSFDAYQTEDANRKARIAGNGRAPTPQWVNWIDPVTKQPRAGWSTPGQSSATAVNLPGIDHGDPATSPTKPLMDQGAVKTLATVLGKAKDTTGFLSGIIGGSKTPKFAPEIQKQVDTMRGQIVATAHTSDAVKENLNDYLMRQGELDGYSNQQLTSEASDPQTGAPLTPDEQQHMLLILGTIRPGK